MNVMFDHIEVHVKDIGGYRVFLEKMFGGGASKVISPSGTSMYTSPDGINIEIKAKAVEAAPAASGFCNPCLRRLGTEKFIKNELGFEIEKVMNTHFGTVYFFRDHEGVMWHIKDIAPETGLVY